MCSKCSDCCLCDDVCTKYEVQHTELPYPDGECFAPKYVYLGNKVYRYAPIENCNGTECNVHNLKIVLKKNDDNILPHLHIPFGVTEVEVEYTE